MDEPHPLKTGARRLSPLVSAFLFSFAALLSACAPPEPKISLPTAASFSDTVKSVAQRRDLEPKHEISLGNMESPPAIAPTDNYRGAPLRVLEQAYKSLGLLPHSSDLVKDLTAYEVLERDISHNRAASAVMWTPDALQLGAPLAALHPDKAGDFARVVAIVQALQEQHFKWHSVLQKVALDDRRSALRALAAGDAVLTVLTAGLRAEDLKLLPSHLGIAAQVAGQVDRLAAPLPNFLRRQLAFPYRHGPSYVYWAFRLRGWSGVNALYANPPLSTAEILYPERYFVKRQAPLHFFPVQLLRRLRQSALELTIGQDALIGLFGSDRLWLSGWRGDQLFSFVDGAGATIVWFSAWRTDDQAGDFLRAYQDVLESHHRVRFRSAAVEKNSSATARSRDQRGWLLQRNGSVALLIGAPASGDLLDLAAEAWQELEMDDEPPKIRFESVRGRRQ